MKRTLLLTCVISAAIATTVAADIPEPGLKWTNPNFGSNAYYLNGNTDGSAALVGQINFGGKMVDRDGNVVNSLSVSGLTPHNGAKSFARIGDYYYITDQDGGIGRFDATGADAWSSASWAPSPSGVVNPGSTVPESIATDGTWLFANSDANRNQIYAYSIDNSAASFVLNEQWNATLPDGGRVRNISYDSGSGYLYMHNGGDGSSTTLYAIDASDGTVSNMGTHTEGTTVHQVLRYGDELLVFGRSDNLTVYDLASDTAIVAGPKNQFDLGLGDLYGATIAGDTLFVASAGGNVSGFNIPEPGTLALLGLGGLLLLPRRSRRRK